MDRESKYHRYRILPLRIRHLYGLRGLPRSLRDVPTVSPLEMYIYV